MKNITILFLLSVLVIVDCQPSEQAIQTAMVQTQQAQPTPSPEVQQTPLADIVLDPALFQSGDLPSQYSSGQIAYQWADGLPQAVAPDNVIIQKVGWDIGEGFDEEYLMIALYESPDDLEQSYQAIIRNFPDKQSEAAQAGDKATFIFLSEFSGRGFIAFTHCKALVAIDMTGANVSKELMQAFAQRVDKRVTPLACME
jgi:hypothetical protein